MGKQPGFLIYADCMALLDKLSDEQAGRVIKAACLYFQEGEVAELDLAEEMVLTLMIQYIQRSTDRYNEICRKRSEAGKKGNQTRWGNDSKSDDNIANASKCEQKVASVANITEHNITEHNLYIGAQTPRQPTTRERRFIKPTVEQVRDYCTERSNGVDPQRFVDHYEANGWMVGKNRMKDWKAAVRQWERNEYNSAGAQSAAAGGKRSPSFDLDAIIKKAREEVPKL